MRPGEIAVARVAARAHAVASQVEGAVDGREARGLEPNTHAAPVGDLVRVPEEPEAGDVRDGVGLDGAQDVGRFVVQRPHPANGALELLCARIAALVAGHDQAGAERLGQEERVAGAGAVLGPDRVWVDHADDCEPVLRLGVADRVASSQKAAGGTDLGIGGGKDLREHLHRKLLRKCRDREREQRRAAHRKHVVERVRRRDRAVVARVVDDGRKEVERENQGALVVQAVHSRVVGRSEPDEQVLRLRGDEARQQLLEPGGRVLGGATATGREICQLHSAGVQVHRRPS